MRQFAPRSGPPGALDLLVAEFDECSGAIKRPRALRDCMKRSTCSVDESLG